MTWVSGRSVVPTSGGGLAQGAAELLKSASLDMSPERPGDAHAIAGLLPAGTCVYVNHLPRRGLAQSIAALAALRAVGLEPVPHIAARRISSHIELSVFLKRAVGEAAVSKALLVGGDEPQPLGPYADAQALLNKGKLAEHGIREVGLAGYPEGHPDIRPAVLERSLREKLALAAAQRLGAYVVTQFSFAPARVVEYCSAMAREFPAVPLYVGIAGPTTARELLRFAQICGVSASLRALEAAGLRAIRLVARTDPHEQLDAVAHYCLGQPVCNIIGVHLYSFGGATATATWINGEITSPQGS